MEKEIEEQVRRAAEELIQCAKLSAGNILVVGCSTSEILGERIGRGSSM